MAIIEETNKEGIQKPLRLDFEVVQTLKIIEFDSGRAALKKGTSDQKPYYPRPAERSGLPGRLPVDWIELSLITSVISSLYVGLLVRGGSDPVDHHYHSGNNSSYSATALVSKS